MKTEQNFSPRCPACRKGNLLPSVRTQMFHPHGKDVSVELLVSRCDVCNEETTRASQHDENLRRLAARKAHYDGLLLGEEIVALRKRYGLTQQAAAKVFGKGKIAFSRYENEASYPDETMTRMLRMALAKPDVLKWLADEAGVRVPLWAERCEDEQRVKLHVLPTRMGTRTTRHIANPTPSLSQMWAAVSARTTSKSVTSVSITSFEASNDGVPVTQEACAS
ncbi:MAG: type II toxin-antitoxin system MqsA family antitoxin [Leptothrix sp. (in: b-proteobacteria)]